jgi:hypothetical protein
MIDEPSSNQYQLFPHPMLAEEDAQQCKESVNGMNSMRYKTKIFIRK